MKKFITQLTEQLTDFTTKSIKLILDKKYMLVNREEFENDLQRIREELEGIENQKTQLYVCEDRIRDIINEELYNLNFDSDCIEGIEEICTGEAEEVVKSIEQKYI